MAALCSLLLRPLSRIETTPSIVAVHQYPDYCLLANLSRPDAQAVFDARHLPIAATTSAVGCTPPLGLEHRWFEMKSFNMGLGSTSWRKCKAGFDPQRRSHLHHG